MSKARVIFHKCIQASQEYGSDDENMVSRVFFNLEIDGRRFEALYADIKQTVGSDYETGPIEVGFPHGYDGPFNHEAFHDCVERYYRSLVGSGAKGIKIGKGARGIRMRNNVFEREMICEFEIK